ncbi:MAG: DUF4190 domain-containing protein [Thermomonas sp.]
MNVMTRTTSTMAIVSLVSGILGWTLVPLIGGVVAVITGHMARSEIRRAPAGLEGDGMAIAGLVLGYAAIAMALLAVIAIVMFFGGLAWLATMSGH